MKQLEFLERNTTKKGAIGEAIVEEYLRGQGLVVYRPGDTDGPHPFDGFGANKRHVLAFDVKAKPARSWYPDTGINVTHFETYRFYEKKYRVPGWLFFVDEAAAKVYGNLLRVLCEKRTVWWEGKNISYPRTERGIIYFPVQYMKLIRELPAELAASLNLMSTRNGEFVANEKVTRAIGSGLLAKQGALAPEEAA